MSEYVAGRNLYQGGRLVYAAGQTVPADAYPEARVVEMLGSGALRRADRQTAPGPAPEAEPEPAVEEPTTPTKARRTRKEAPADGE